MSKVRFFTQPTDPIVTLLRKSAQLEKQAETKSAESFLQGISQTRLGMFAQSEKHAGTKVSYENVLPLKK